MRSLQLVSGLLWAVSVCSINPGPGVFDLYYKTGWETAYLHYNAGEGWNGIPGDAFSKSTNSSFPASEGWYVIEVEGNSVTFVTTNGNGQWDNNGGRNYETKAPGIYSLANGNLVTIETFGAACPEVGGVQCDGHGTCDEQSFTCKCSAAYWGVACESVCPGGSNTPCSNHGTCNQQDGSCKCSLGWASCSSQNDCSSNVSQDPNNCGGCGIICKAGEGVQSAVCSNATCHRTCDPGYTLCPDDECHPGTECPLPGCGTYSDNQCQGNIIVTPSNYTDRRWQTPKPDSPEYQPSYQHFYTLQGHVRIQYSPSLTSANVTVVTVQKDPSVQLKFTFGGSVQTSPSKTFSAGSDAAAIAEGAAVVNGPLMIFVNGSDGSSLVLEEVDFVWNAPAVKERQGDFRGGQKGAIVEMFGWPHEDVEQECQFLAQHGYLGAKLFPVHEQVMSDEPFVNVMNPWYFMYQPVSYRLQGRMGTRDQLRAAIYTCRQLGVRMYADAVANHMTGNGNDGNPHHRDNNCNYFPQKNTSAAAESPFFTQGFCYEPNANTGLPPSQEFPGVPYGPTDFHCERVLNSWTSPLDLNAGWLTGLVDLNTEKENVQQRIADYMTDLLSIGFSGFRIDAAKHMRPDDLVGVFTKLRSNMGGKLPGDFFVWMEVLLGGESDMLLCNADSGYNYAKYMENALSAAGFTADEINQLKIWFSAYPKQPDADCGQLSMLRKVIQNDDADQQMPGSSSRDMQSYGSVLVKERNVPLHRSFEEKLFQSPRGVTDNDNDYPIRVVLSSYYFEISQQPYGIPDGKSDCALCRGPWCKDCRGSMNHTDAYQADAVGYAGPVYTRVHRDAAIISAMQGWMHIDGSADEEA